MRGCAAARCHDHRGRPAAKSARATDSTAMGVVRSHTDQDRSVADDVPSLPRSWPAGNVVATPSRSRPGIGEERVEPVDGAGVQRLASTGRHGHRLKWSPRRRSSTNCPAGHRWLGSGVRTKSSACSIFHLRLWAASVQVRLEDRRSGTGPVRPVQVLEEMAMVDQRRPRFRACRRVDTKARPRAGSSGLGGAGRSSDEDPLSRSARRRRPLLLGLRGPHEYREKCRDVVRGEPRQSRPGRWTMACRNCRSRNLRGRTSEVLQSVGGSGVGQFRGRRRVRPASADTTRRPPQCLVRQSTAQPSRRRWRRA